MSDTFWQRLARGLDGNSVPCAVRYGAVRYGAVHYGILVAGAAVLLWSYWWRGLAGLHAAGLAAVLCVIAGVTAWGLTAWQMRQGRPLRGMLWGMTARMVPLLLVCLLLAVGQQAPRTAGNLNFSRSFASYLVVFYLITLALETRACVQCCQLACFDRGAQE